MRFWFTKKSTDDPYDLLQSKAADATAPADGSAPDAKSGAATADATSATKASTPSASAGTAPKTPAPTGSTPNAQVGTAPAPQGMAPAFKPATAPVEGPHPAAPTKRDRKEFYYGLMNALYDAVLILDANGHITDCSERVVSVLARTREELWDLPISELIPSIDAKILRQMQDGLHGKRRVLLNARCRRGDGTLFPAEVGAGLMNLIGESLVLTIRNVERRTPAKAIIRPQAKTAQPTPQGESHPAEVKATPGTSGDSPRVAVFHAPMKTRVATL